MPVCSIGLKEVNKITLLIVSSKAIQFRKVFTTIHPVSFSDRNETIKPKPKTHIIRKIEIAEVTMCDRSGGLAGS